MAADVRATWWSNAKEQLGDSACPCCRCGNGIDGNVGREAIAHVVSAANGVFTAVRNPMAAAGGVDPEDMEAWPRVGWDDGGGIELQLEAPERGVVLVARWIPSSR